MCELISQENNVELDLLDRQPFVDKIIKICERLSESKKNVCFAINGDWGVGKSFVLKMFEEQLSNIQQSVTATDKYMIFHYNSWNYDYYEEPIIAIVAAMLDDIERNEKLVATEIKEKVKGVLKAVGGGLLLKFNSVIEEKTGIKPNEIMDVIKDCKEDTIKKIESSKSFDTYFSFKEILLRLRDTIKSLADEKTIVIVVDELDRCLPEYMIKVLERLHHVFYEIPNVQVIISVDKKQLSHTVKQIYGESTDVDRYLSKFIEFELCLNAGDLNDYFDQKFSTYINNFDYINSSTKQFDVDEFKTKIFNGIDMRSRIEIINKCELLHSMMKSEEKDDYSVMCIEIFLLVLKYWKVDLIKSKNAFTLNTPFTYDKKTNVLSGLDFLCIKYEELDKSDLKMLVWDNGKEYVRCNDIWTLVFSCYRYILGYTRDVIQFNSYDGRKLHNYSNEFWNLLNLIC